MTNKMAGEQEVGGCRVSTAQGSRGAAPVLLCGDVREGAKGGAAAARGRRGRGVGAVEERQGRRRVHAGEREGRLSAVRFSSAAAR